MDTILHLILSEFCYYEFIQRYKATDDNVLTTPPRVSRTHSEIERREIERENKLKYAQRLGETLRSIYKYIIQYYYATPTLFNIEKQQNESRERRRVVEDDKQVCATS